MGAEHQDTGTKKIGLPEMTGRAGHVVDGFKPSAYTGQKATSTTALAIALATGATKVIVVNESATAAEFVYLAFGTSSANAISNAANGVPVMAGEKLRLDVPLNATHFAYQSASGTPNISISQGT